MSIEIKREQRVASFKDREMEQIRKSICKDGSDEDFEMFVRVCAHTGLNPFMKQIYPVFRNDKGVKRMTIQTSIDGFRLIAERTGRYSPGREATHVYSEKGSLISSTSYVKKLTPDGTWHEVAATAHFNELCQRYGDKLGQFWEKMPHVMLAKCAEAAALRRAFPAEMSQVYTKDEMEQATPPEPIISEEEWAKLDALVQTVNDQEFMKKITDHLEISSIYDLLPKDFGPVVRRLEKKIIEMGAA